MDWPVIISINVSEGDVEAAGAESPVSLLLTNALPNNTRLLSPVISKPTSFALMVMELLVSDVVLPLEPDLLL